MHQRLLVNLLIIHADVCSAVDVSLPVSHSLIIY